MLRQYLPRPVDADQPLSGGSPCGRGSGNMPSASCLARLCGGLLSLWQRRGRRGEERGGGERVSRGRGSMQGAKERGIGAEMMRRL